MFSPRRRKVRAFTLIELMIVVLIIGILSTMGVEAYRHQVALAKTAEPRAMLGAIRRGVSIAAEQDWTKYEVLEPGQVSTTASTGKVTGGGSGSSSSSSSSGNGKGKGKGSGSNGNSGSSGGGATVVHGSSTILCNSADAVPKTFQAVKRQRYQSSITEWTEGDRYTGWPCLGFQIQGPQYYQYGYDFGGPKVQVTLPKGGNPPGLDKDLTYTAWARGDLDGDGRTSWFVTQGALIDNRVVHATGIGVVDEAE